MSGPYSTFCDDFYLNMRLGSQMTLPNNRETVLHVFERIQKTFPTMSLFRKSESGDLSLEEERENNKYRWASIEPRRLACGHVNPDSVEDAMKLHTLMLQIAPYHVGISPIEIDYLDVLFGFDIAYSGNHDEVVVESLMHDSPLACLLEEPAARPVNFQPSMTVALSDDCRLQARIDIATRTTSYQVRTGNYNGEAVSVFLTVRRYWGDSPPTAMEEIFAEITHRCDQLAANYLVPRVLRPLSEAIASRS